MSPGKSILDPLGGRRNDINQVDFNPFKSLDFILTSLYRTMNKNIIFLRTLFLKTNQFVAHPLYIDAQGVKP